MVPDLERRRRNVGELADPECRLPRDRIERRIRCADHHHDVRIRVPQAFEVAFDSGSLDGWIDEVRISVVSENRSAGENRYAEDRRDGASHQFTSYVGEQYARIFEREP